MDYHTDFAVKLNTETEYSSLYEWCLQEFDSDGEQVGRDLIPWSWSLYFTDTNLRQTYILKNENSD